MPALMQRRELILVGAIALPTILVFKHALNVYMRIAPALRSRIHESDAIPASLEQSATNTSIVNPRGHQALHDTRYIDLQVPGVHVCDEALLAAFVRGFFGGQVFAPERGLLRFFRPDMVNFHALKADTPSGAIWSIAQLDGDELPPLYTILFGGFQIANIESHTEAGAQDAEETSSSVDIVFGSDGTEFAGVHRFSVIRNKDTVNCLRISYAHVACNPTLNKSLGPHLIFLMHKVYAMWLFREGSVEVMRRLEST